MLTTNLQALFQANPQTAAAFGKHGTLTPTATKWRGKPKPKGELTLAREAQEARTAALPVCSTCYMQTSFAGECGC